MSRDTGCLHELFERQAAARPDATALVHAGERIGYAELDARADRLARGLAARGVPPGRTVGICLDRRIDLVVAVLGVLKAGCAYTMLDPAFPDRRLAGVIGSADAVTVLTECRALPRAVSFAKVAAYDGAGPRVRTRAADPACVMFTSGSTSAPKGILTPHAALTATLVGQDYAAFGPEEVWLQCSPVSWDAFALELFGPLITGGVCVLQSGGAPEPEEIAELVVEHGITTVYVSASLMNFLLDEHPSMFTGLRQVLTGGEPASLTHVDRLLREFPGLRVVNGYSPAENTIFTCCHTIEASDVAATSIPVGRAIANKATYVLDEKLRPVPPGVTGELYMAGDGLAYGYAGALAPTAERFVADPFGPPGRRMYRTGDLVRERADGALEFLGRADQQVKIRGFRVEPAEIEAVLTSHPRVTRAAVAPFGEGTATQLIAYVVGGADEEELRTHAAGRLPAHLVPARFLALPALPRTATGKLDRAALPAPTRLEPAGRSAATADERLLCGLFAEVLGLPEVRPEENFFALGGHSLAAAKVVGRLLRLDGVRLPARTVFDAPTAAQLAAELEHAPRAGHASARPADGIGRRPDDGPAPLSPLQTRLWIADRLNPGTAEYVIPIALRIGGPLDRAALGAALTAIARRHEPLRSRIVEAGGEPVQVVDTAGPVALPVTDITDVERFVTEQAGQGIDLANGPLLRVALGRLAPDDHVLTLCVHHIVADDWSVSLLASELAHHYADAVGLPGPRQDALPELPVAFRDVAWWQRARSSRLDTAAAYWRERLAGMPTVVELPADHDRPARRDIRGDRREFTIPTELAARVAAFGRAHGATSYMVLLAAFTVLIQRRTGMHDFGIGTPVAGRDHPDTESLIGFFVNTVVLRAELSGDPDFATVLTRTRETVLDALHHQELPFDRLVDEVKPVRDASRNPLVQLDFALRTAGTSSWPLPGLDVRRLPADTRTSKFDLLLDLEERPDGSLAGVAEYPVALFDPATMDRLIRHYLSVLEHAIERPDLPVDRLPMLTSTERDWLADVLYGPGQTDPGEATLPALVARQVRLRPEAVAVDDGARRLTYGELDTESARIAAHVAAAVARPEARVAVRLPRNADAVVAALGVLRAGGVVVPLEPDEPADRVARVLTATRADVLLTRRGLAEGLDARADAPVLIWEELGAAPTAPPRTVRCGNAAYVVFTSGTTGPPKAVRLTHEGVARLAPAAFGDPGQVLAVATPLESVPAILGMWGALGNGARLVLHPPTVVSLGETIARSGATSTWLATGHLHAMLRSRPDALDGLRRLVTGGEPLSPVLVRALLDHGVRVDNAYGPTEATGFACSERELGHSDSARLIGRPAPGTRLYVLDDRLAQVPVGVPGELMIAGRGLARGYDDRPDLTALHFIADPFVPGERMFRTGDLVRLHADGAIEFLGRRGDRVAIRGLWADPARTEARLYAHPDIGQALVVDREGPGGERRLIAYVVGRGEVPVDAAALRRFCLAGLPRHQVPAAVVELAAFPLNPHGKVDRPALPTP
ncbi:amino acid adenylation domain-containing protein [Streptomyces lavendofoliae]|uniref:amino acid adenylation domain-containing protein n=1 Tax=Streptomyces lavendofoliae TaxID=67314 RepID=UPI003D8A8DF4